MTGLVTNAHQLAKKYQQRALLLKAKLKKRLVKLGSKIENEQVDLLSGGQVKPGPVLGKQRDMGMDSGSYPVPVRTGSLRRGVLAPAVTGLTLNVGNSSSYAVTIHEGRGSSKKHGPRRFVFDAIEKSDAAGAISRAYFEALAI